MQPNSNPESSKMFLYTAILLCFVLVSSGTATVEVITFNTGLLEQTGHEALGSETQREPRRNAIIQQLNETTADVTCLQEVFMADDVHAIINELAPTYPYSYSVVHDMNGQLASGYAPQPPCSAATFTSFVTCLTTHCTGATTEAQAAACIAANCSTEFFDLSDDCLGCYRTAGFDFSNIVTRCTATTSNGFRRMNTPGLLILSKTPMKGARHVDLHPGSREVVERGYLEAKVEGIGRFVCAHTTNYGFPAYFELDTQSKTGISSWVEQGTDEITKIVETFSDERRVIVAGDFNVGPEIPPNVTAVQPAIFDIRANAFCNDILEQCTFCMTPENRYNLGVSRVIDHMLYQGYESVSKERIFDGYINFGIKSSDHFGVKHVLKLARCKQCRSAITSWGFAFFRTTP